MEETSNLFVGCENGVQEEETSSLIRNGHNTLREDLPEENTSRSWEDGL